MMRAAPLTPGDKPQWAELLAVSFNRTPDDMLRLLDWLHQGHTVIGWGAWDGDTLAAQYNCAMMHITQPDGVTVPVGMSINMAVDPAYRGRGLIKQVSQPVYEAVAACGGVSGIGFSNKQGVKVDLKSKSYGYQVVGQMQSLVVWLRPQRQAAITLTDAWPRSPFAQAASANSLLSRFATTPETLAHRFADHPFRRYQFGVWEDGGMVQGVVVYRKVRLAGVKGVSLLAAYGAQCSELLARWSAAIQREGMRFLHVLSTPQGRVRSELHTLGYVATMPYSRSPYYLTVKPFANTPKAFLDFKAWDCLGGDIL
ncbi:MAG: GNAT family N-acetyltransferase [Chloroflexi bacterium]|nr:GNAT family N-acetyltransferase [Chloroflexota bacterium]MCC6893008.1 GNAT family N-acetyltransferase [Anaerolineae bacterium]